MAHHPFLAPCIGSIAVWFCAVLHALPVAAQPPIKFHEHAIDESAGNLAAFRIETPSATYLLEKSGAGLSSLIDVDGHDWINFHPRSGSRAGGEYRGFPNAVHRQAGNYFHPKNDATEPSHAVVTSVTPSQVTISVQSENQLWAARYDFFPSHCTFTVTRMPADKRYWVLYEGTPGGQFHRDDWWFTSAVPQRNPLTIDHIGDIPGPEWIAFGDPRMKRCLFLLHHQDDRHPDRFYAMNDEMTVFGFGRRGIKKFLDATGQPFSIGLLETDNHQQVAERMQALLDGPAP